MIQMTLRYIPKNMDERIRALSKKSGESINQTILRLMKKSLGMESDSPTKKRDVRKLAGTWTLTDEQEFKKNTAVFERMDPELWDYS